MKKLILIAIIVLFLTTGCGVSSDSMKGITIYTSSYPIEYITEKLYKNNSIIYSIYPTGTNIHQYELTNNQIENISRENIVFIYNGLMRKEDNIIEANYAAEMIKKNDNIKIIDASKGMEYNSNIEEIWLNPSNMLMMANNIKSGLIEYIKNPYLAKDVETNYDSLQLELSALDANYKSMYENANSTIIVTSSDIFKFLEKYKFTVLSLEENSNLNTKLIADVKALINAGTVKYIYIKSDETVSKTVQSLLDTTSVKVLEINTISMITQVQRDNKENYISIMENNLLQYQMEVYK